MRIWPFKREPCWDSDSPPEWCWWPYFTSTWHIGEGYGREFTVTCTPDYLGWRWWWYIVPSAGTVNEIASCGGGTINGDVWDQRVYWLRIAKFEFIYCGRLRPRTKAS